MLLVRDNNDKQSRLVAITGEPGIGKSDLACSTLFFIQERGCFSGGCVYIDAKDKKTVEKHFLPRLIKTIIEDSGNLFEGNSRQQI
jgi:ABC-type dipeptide/oligopeptide/nickel transport system ATPase component